MSKVSQYTSGSTLSGTETLYIVQSGNSRKIPVSNIITDPLFTPSGTGAVARSVQSKERDIVSVKDFGAVGDGVTDDTAAIQAAIAACDAAVSGTGAITLHFSAGTYLISQKLSYSCSFEGDGSGSVTIKAKAAFADSMMIDFNAGTSGKHITGIAFDTNGQNIKIFGSSSAGTAGGSSIGYYRDLQFNSTSATTYAVGGSSGSAEIGMLTGAVMENCVFNAPKALYIGNNQDDFTGIGLRFNDVGQGLSYIISCQGQDQKLIDSYIFLSAAGAASVEGVIQVSGGAVEFDGLFVEGTTKLDWLFDGQALARLISFRRLVMNVNYTGAHANAALVRAHLSSATAQTNRTKIDGIKRQTGASVAWPAIMNVLNPNNVAATTELGPIYLEISGCEEFALTELLYESAGFANTARPIKVSGEHRGHPVGYYATFTGAAGVLGTTVETPSFMARTSGDKLNVTGTGTVYTVVFDTLQSSTLTGTADSGSFNVATGVFTALRAGWYQFDTTVWFGDITAAMTSGDVKLTTTSHTYRAETPHPGNIRNVSNRFSWNPCFTVFMSVNDTAKVDVNLSGGAGDTADIISESYFSGHFVSP